MNTKSIILGVVFESRMITKCNMITIRIFLKGNGHHEHSNDYAF